MFRPKLKGRDRKAMRFPQAMMVAILSSLAALALRLLVDPWLDERSPLMIFVLPVLLSGYVGGLSTGIFATWLGATLGRLFFIEPLHSLCVPDFYAQANLLLFVIIGLAISVMAPLARRGQQLTLQMKLQESERAFREAVLQEKAVQDERQRLSRELHDSVSQAFYGIGLGARTALVQLEKDPKNLEGPLRYVLTLAESGLAEMRALVQELRPEMLESEGVAAALTHQVRAMAGRYGLEARLALEEPEVSLTHKHGLYRVTMEALHNVVKHAQASNLDITLGSVDGAVFLEIKDDGKGFDANDEFPGHWGIRTMRERVERLGGLLKLSSRPGQGTTVRVEFPRHGGANES